MPIKDKASFKEEARLSTEGGLSSPGLLCWLHWADLCVVSESGCFRIAGDMIYMHMIDAQGTDRNYLASKAACNYAAHRSKMSNRPIWLAGDALCLAKQK